MHDLKTINNRDILLVVKPNFDSPYIYKSIDSGYTWTIKHWYDKNVYAHGFDFPNQRLAILGCDSGYYFRSTNNGETWQTHRFENGYRNRHVSFWDDKNGIIFQTKVNEPQIIIKSSDGGISWTEIKGPKPDDYTYFGNLITKGEGICYFISLDLQVDSVYYFHKSTDYGETWEKPYKGPTVKISSCNFYFYNENLGFCFGGSQFGAGLERKTIRRTDDGGRNWKVVYDSIFFPFSRIQDVHFADSLNGIATSLWNIFRTTDAGLSWTVDPTFNYEDFGYGMGKVILLNNDNAVGISLVPWKYIYRYQSKNNVSVNDIEHFIPITTYPNPAKNILNLSLPDEFPQIIDYRIYTSDGKEIKYGAFTGASIDISALATGTYFLLFSTGEKIWYSKFVKE